MEFGFRVFGLGIHGYESMYVGFQFMLDELVL